jgi:hypothetical protein
VDGDAVRSGGRPDGGALDRRALHRGALDGNALDGGGREQVALDEVVEHLERGGSDDDPARAYLLGWGPTGWLIEDIVPIDRLLGLRAGPSCWAVAVVASGRARRIDATPGTGAPAPGHPEDEGRAVEGPDVEGPEDGGRDRGLRSVRLSVALARSGRAAGRLSAGGVVRAQVPSAGRVLDTMRRSLGLSTPRAPEGTARLLAALWLAAALEMVAEADELLDWSTLVQLHPAIRLLTAHGERLRRPELNRIVVAAPATLTWEVLRQAESRFESITPLCPPGAAAWMDTGMYARWVLADLPAPEMLWRRLRDRLAPTPRRRLAQLLAEWGVAAAGQAPSRLAS